MVAVSSSFLGNQEECPNQGWRDRQAAQIELGEYHFRHVALL